MPTESQQPTLLTVPTELERTDGFIDLAVLVGAVLAVWWLCLKGVPIEFIAPFTVPLAIWVLTGEAAGDVPFLGAVAAGLRSLLGLRRAHEWLFAWAHYFTVGIWPIWKERCGTFSRSSRQQVTDWRRRLSARIKWRRSPAS